MLRCRMGGMVVRRDDTHKFRATLMEGERLHEHEHSRRAQISTETLRELSIAHSRQVLVKPSASLGVSDPTRMQSLPVFHAAHRPLPPHTKGIPHLPQSFHLPYTSPTGKKDNKPNVPQNPRPTPKPTPLPPPPARILAHPPDVHARMQ